MPIGPEAAYRPSEGDLVANPKPFNVDLAALVSEMAGHLYTNETVVVREMLANCRDALVRAKRQKLPGPPRIDVDLDFPSQSIRFRDNGPGMTEEEVVGGLSTLAGSYTRVLRSSRDEPEDADFGFTGQFGLGFFSSLMISRGVEVTTSTGDGGPALRWRCGAETVYQSTYTLESIAPRPRGTEVILYLKPEYLSGFLDRSSLCELIRKYADFVEFPILVAGAGPVNRMTAPWEGPGDGGEVDTEACRQYLLRRGLADNESLIWSFVVGRSPTCRALLYVPDPSADGPGIEIHSRRIFVRTSTDLVPEHLSFVSGVALCDDLPLTMGREDMVEGRALEELRRHLHRQVLDQFGRLVKDGGQRGTVTRLAREYARELKVGCIEDGKLLEIVGRHLNVPTLSGRPRSLGDAADDAARSSAIYFVQDRDTQGAAGALLEAQTGVPVFDVSDRLDWVLLNQFAAHTQTEVRRADTSLQDLVASYANPEFRGVEALCAAASDGFDPKAVRFRGECRVPALVVADRSGAMQEMLRQFAGAGALDGMEDAMAYFGRRSSGARRMLLLNIEHPLIGLLRDACNRSRKPHALLPVAKAIIACADSYSRHLASSERASAYECQAGAFQTLLGMMLSQAGTAGNTSQATGDEP